jgi:hypothetical protein
MKKTIITIALASLALIETTHSAMASQNYICPEKIVCSGGTCALPSEFVNPFSGGVMDNTFEFYKSSNLPHPFCQYSADGKSFNQQFYIQPYLKADINLSVQNSWMVSANGAALCASYNPADCPWKLN